jgi:hypothetical protein
VKILSKILLILFVLQSTWAVAAQYCQHEESPKVEHIGHHTHKHTSQSADSNHVTDQKSSDSSKSGVDTDCPFCHLSSIKSMISNLPVIDAEIESVVIVGIYRSYPEIIPLKPERPNWNLAV